MICDTVIFTYLLVTVGVPVHIIADNILGIMFLDMQLEVVLKDLKGTSLLLYRN